MTARTRITGYGLLQQDGPTVATVCIAETDGGVVLTVAADGPDAAQTRSIRLAPESAEHLSQRLAVAASIARTRGVPTSSSPPT